MAQKWKPEEIEVVQKYYKPDSRNYAEISEKLNSSRTPVAVEKFIKYSPFWKPKPERKRIKELHRENDVLRQVIESLEVRQSYNLHKYEGEYVRFGVISDTQCGSRYANMPFLSLAYDIFEREGIHTVYHSGDLVDGKMRHHGHEFELLVHGEDAQRDYCVNEYPQRDGVDTYFITGNHDLSFFKLSGSDIGEKIAQIRPDMHYLGQESADIDIETRDGKVKCNLSHPGKGTAYAICFDDKTEVLTYEGWKLFKDLNRSELVATLNPKTDQFEWQTPTAYTDQQYYGNLYHFKARCFDLMVTPEHRLWVRRYKRSVRTKPYLFPQKAHGELDYNWQFITAKDASLAKLKQTWQMRRGCVDFKPLLYPEISDDWIMLCGWYVTEGCGHKNAKQFTITQSPSANPENYNEICGVLTRLGIKFFATGREKKDLCVSRKKITTWMVENFGRTSREKRLPVWVKNLPKRQLAILLETMIKGDGWKKGRGFGYKSISDTLLDDVQEIAIKCGYGATKGGDTVTITSEQVFPTINKKPEEIDYSGRVYCVSVPNQIILVRRNGKAIWSGNSYHSQKHIESLERGTKPNLILVGHFHKMEKIFYQNVHLIQTGTTQYQTPFMKRNNNAAMLGLWIGELVLDDDSIRRCKAEWIPCYK